MSEDKNQYPIDKLLEEISARREDRGFLAELRRGLNPATEEQAWPHIARYAAKSFDDDAKRRVWVIVGALAATLIPDGLCANGFASVGTAMRKIKEGNPSLGESGIKSYDTKFRRLLNSSDVLDLCEIVSEIGRNAAQKGVALNCRTLFWDLWNWDDDDKREKTRIRWARDFYGVFSKCEESLDAGTPEEGADE